MFNNSLISCSLVKETVSQDFLLQMFFMNHLPQAPGNNRVISKFSKIHGDIRKSRCTAGINNTGGKFATGINKIGGKIVAGINDTGGKFATGINDISGKILPSVPLVLFIPVANLSQCQ